jgi:outer membrane protein
VNSAINPAAALLLLALAHSLTAQTLSLRDAAEEALARNPAIVAAVAREQAAAARTAQARAAFLPRIDLSETVTRGNNPVFVFGSLLEQGRFTSQHFDPASLNAPDSLTNYRAAITARFALFDGFQTASAVRQGKNATGRAGVELDEVRQRVRGDVVARFYGLLLAEEKLAVAKEAVKAAEADAATTRDRFEQGLLVESDALAAEVQLAGFRERVIDAEGELAIARAALATLLQHPMDDTITVAGTLPATPFDAPPLDEVVARAMANQSAVKTASSATSDARLHLSAERGSMLPRVDAFGTLGASGASLGRGNSDHTAGLAVTLSVFDHARPARIAAARAGIETARAEESMVGDAARMEAITAWYRLRAAGQTVAVAATAVDQAQSAARIVRDRYEQGLTTITEHLRAQTALLTARFDLLGAQYESAVTRAELLRITGDLTDVDSFR